MAPKNANMQKITEICERFAGKLEYYLCDVAMEKEPTGRYLRIYIEDTGAGMSEARCRAVLQEMRGASFDDLDSAKSVGIINACLRLKKCFGDGLDFELDSEEGAGLCITISIPVTQLKCEEGK